MSLTKRRKILGQDPNVLVAIWENLLSWIVRSYFPWLLPHLLPVCPQEEDAAAVVAASAKDTAESAAGTSGDWTTVAGDRTQCISIGRPGGMEQLRLIHLKKGIMTCGYNIPGQDVPFTKPLLTADDLPPDCVVLQNEAFSVNYADCCIRWGLYQSANEFVGYPICPGFDVAGVVTRVGAAVESLAVGDRVFGCSLFGAYSTQVLVPEVQLRKLPSTIPTAVEAASLPTVGLTALYALHLAGHFPHKSAFRNRAILIHSAAGGVGSMLVQMSKILGLQPIVGVVGRTQKVDAARALGCDVVIDKSQEDLWTAARKASPGGYSTIMDSNGISTLQDSYDHLTMTGRLVVYGFHTNLPISGDMLSPMEWIRMAIKMQSMPAFNPMELVENNKSVLGFNLSFFADERPMLSELFDQYCEWLEKGMLAPSRVTEFEMAQIVEAHELIQSGTSVGKIVLRTS